MNIPKFYVGQRVVAVKSSKAGTLGKVEKGVCYTINAIKRGCCCEFDVQVGLSIDTRYRCGLCKTEYEAGEMWVNQDYFAPIHEDFKAITFEKIVEKELTSAN